MAPLVIASKPTLGPPKKRFPWRGLLLLTALAVAARVFLVESLVVASGSMEPLLHGDPARGDELLVVRHWWQAFAPSRFDLVVFERPAEEARAEERIVVKRVVAVGGESVRIDRGELWIRERGGVERRLVKQYDDFRDLLVPLWREPFDGETLSRLVPDDPALVTVAGRAVVLDGSPEGGCSVELARDATTADDGWLAADGTRAEGHEDVTDLCYAVDLSPGDATTCVVFLAGFGGDQCVFSATPVAGSWRVELERTEAGRGSTEVHGTAAPVKVGKAQRFEFWQIDGCVGAAIDSTIAFQKRLAANTETLVARSAVRPPALQVRNGRARLSGFAIARDLHWTSPSDAHYAIGSACEVPEGSVFLLGDASGQSQDSRHYGPVPRAQLRGRPLAIWRPSGRRRTL